MPPRKKIKVEDKDLSRWNAFGFATIETKLIELDHRIKGKTRLRYLIHELLHHLHPEMSENKHKKLTKIFVDVIWKQSYRKVDTRLK